jgi:hypothetical protein
MDYDSPGADLLLPGSNGPIPPEGILPSKFEYIQTIEYILGRVYKG